MWFDHAWVINGTDYTDITGRVAYASYLKIDTVMVDDVQLFKALVQSMIHYDKTFTIIHSCSYDVTFLYNKTLTTELELWT